MGMKLAGIVLAGGQSRRFGSDKALETYEESTFLDVALKELKAVTETVAVIGRTNHSNENVQFYGDSAKYKGMGPLAGLYTAMKKVQADWYLVLACDMPLIDQEILAVLQSGINEKQAAVIPVIHGKCHPLCALYHCSAFSMIERLLDQKQLKMMTLLDQLNPVYLDESNFKNPGRFANINRREDLRILGEGDRQSFN
ncbi:molybdenum cofactor guanylyltransferase [Peribacillus frigoritolerans]|uniref:molybdenum cofactor guanylyltransferase n=1 Tax=Peribacillus frigoritolerans TaxID=450367 RepID=UPI00105A16B2|nr:molybdenum cofactor guanylyltransferase [Peribacillus frigoritolerans]TDL80272.1 molybdenum cofactor guanylyltransferase [Peribacillus frigoritolerans]